MQSGADAVAVVTVVVVAVVVQVDVVSGTGAVSQGSHQSQDKLLNCFVSVKHRSARSKILVGGSVFLLEGGIKMFSLKGGWKSELEGGEGGKIQNFRKKSSFIKKKS